MAFLTRWRQARRRSDWRANAMALGVGLTLWSGLLTTLVLR